MAFIDPQKGSFRPHWANLLPPNAPALAQCPAYLSDPDFYFLERPHLRQKTTIAAPANHSARHAFRLLLSAQGSEQSMSYWFSIPASAPQKRTPSPSSTRSIPFAGSLATFASNSRTCTTTAASLGSFSTIAADPPVVHGNAFQSFAFPFASSVINPSFTNADARLNSLSTFTKPWSLTTQRITRPGNVFSAVARNLPIATSSLAITSRASGEKGYVSCSVWSSALKCSRRSSGFFFSRIHCAYLTRTSSASIEVSIPPRYGPISFSASSSRPGVAVARTHLMSSSSAARQTSGMFHVTFAPTVTGHWIAAVVLPAAIAALYKVGTFKSSANQYHAIFALSSGSNSVFA